MLSPAKINLGLKILFKRIDGYHELQSIFLKLDWGDEIQFEELPEGRFELITKNELKGKSFYDFEEVSVGSKIQNNILYKTFIKSKSIKNISGVKINLIKKIPTGGGLGGGSSNAALLLKYLFPEEISHSPKFLNFSSRIGADIPFFLKDGHQLVGGIGEKLQDIKIKKGFGILVSTGYIINTGSAFNSLKKPLQKDPPSETWNCLQKEVLFSLENGEWGKLLGILSNEFEDFALDTYPNLRDLKQEMLDLGLPYVSMTGSGSSFYGIISDKSQRDKIFNSLITLFPEYDFYSFRF